MAQAIFKSPFTSGGAFKNPFDKSGSGAGDTLAKLAKQNTNNRTRLAAVGTDVPKPNTPASFLEKLMGPLQTPLAGVNTVIHNVTTDGPDLDVFKEMGKAFTGKDYINGSDLFQEWGWKPGTPLGKLAQGVTGFVWDIAADPITYLTLGYGAYTKIAAVGNAADIYKAGLGVDDAVRFGLKELLPEIEKAGGRLAIENLGDDVGKAIWKGVLKDAAIEMGDKGGIKLFGMSLVSNESVGNAVPQGVKALVDMAQGSKAAMTAGGLFSRTYRVAHARNPLKAAALSEFLQEFSNGVAKGTIEGYKFGKEMLEALPEKSRNLFGIALEGSIDDAVRASLDDLFDVARKAETPEIAQEAMMKVRDILADGTFRPEKFAGSLKLLDPSHSDDEIAKATEAATLWMARMKQALVDERAAGVKVGDLAETYFPHMSGETSAEVRNAVNVSQGGSGGLTDVLTPEQTFGRPSGAVSAPDFGKKRSIASVAERLEKDIATETFAPKVGAIRVASGQRAIAAENLKTSIGEAFGHVLKEGDDAASGFVKQTIGGKSYAIDELVWKEVQSLVKPMESDDATREFMKFFNSMTSVWKRWATVMNPGFPIRNAISNMWLAHTKDLSDPAAWSKALPLAKEMLDGKNLEGMVEVGGKVGSVTKAELLDAFQREGGFKGGQALETLADDPTRLLTQGLHPVKTMQRIGTDTNELVETWGRLAVFMQTWGKTGSSRLAGRMADKVLYNYSPSALTSFEQGMRSVIPFMVWTRRNLPEMLSVLLHDPSKISEIGKLQKNMADVSPEINQDILPGYMRDMVPIPLPFTDKQGNPLMLNPNVGFQDLNKLDLLRKGEMPFKDFLASINPFFKVPLELAFNRDAFFGSDIVRYQGEKRKAPGYVQQLNNVFEGQGWWDATVKKLGGVTVDGTLKMSPVAIKAMDMWPFAANFGKALEEDNPQSGWRAMSWLLGVKMMPYQEDKYTKDKMYEERDSLLNAIRKLKDEGTVVPTMKELQ